MRFGWIGCLPKLRRVRAYSRHTISGAITSGAMTLGVMGKAPPYAMAAFCMKTRIGWRVICHACCVPAEPREQIGSSFRRHAQRIGSSFRAARSPSVRHSGATPSVEPGIDFRARRSRSGVSSPMESAAAAE
jgi:hypothetical protein